jgi:hypothetical protein
MTGTNCGLFTNKSSRSYLNHLVNFSQSPGTLQPTHTTEGRTRYFNILILTHIHFNPTIHALTLHVHTMNVIWTGDH